MSNSQTMNHLNKKILIFYTIELITAIVYTLVEGFSGLIWLTVVISYLGIVPKFMPSQFSSKAITLISLVCLVLSSALWGYIIMYYLSTAPVIYSIILVTRIIATIIGFKEIRDHIIVVVPLLIGFALLKQPGCIPPIAF